jgi:hypothetical protein
VEQGKKRRKKKRTQTIEPFNRDIDEHEMHLKHKRRKKNNKQKCITFFFTFKQQKDNTINNNQETLALRMRGL